MEKVVVISQSMYFPWCGLLDQVKNADVFVHYDDVQLSRGFYSRVQAKTPNGIKWLTVPLQDRHQGRRIDDSLISYSENWIEKHRGILLTSYARAPFLKDALQVFDSVFVERKETLGQLGRATIRACADYFGVGADTQFLESSTMGIGGASSQRLLDITSHVGGSIYLTGHGALNYLDHELFEKQGIEVRYMNYHISEYPQRHGPFTPYVTCLDAIAHLGRDCGRVLRSEMVSWKDAAAAIER
ncbi:hypothetical protein LSUCC0031_04975 [Rhodobacterales bacterium LSUCC0031]|nr:hypothetical protein [Rhodobacterales bacterium LSUCC0031]